MTQLVLDGCQPYFQNRISRGAYAMWRYLLGVQRINGWIRMRASTLMRIFKRAESTVRGWLRELYASGKLRSQRHGRACCSFIAIEVKSIGQTHRSEPPLLITEPTEKAPTERKPPAAERSPGFAAELRKHLEGYGVGWGADDFMGCAVAVAAESGRGAVAGAAAFAALARQKRFIGRGDGYFMAALREELKSRAMGATA